MIARLCWSSISLRQVLDGRIFCKTKHVSFFNKRFVAAPTKFSSAQNWSANDQNWIIEVKKIKAILWIIDGLNVIFAFRKLEQFLFSSTSKRGSSIFRPMIMLQWSLASLSRRVPAGRKLYLYNPFDGKLIVACLSCLDRYQLACQTRWGLKTASRRAGFRHSSGGTDRWIFIKKSFKEKVERKFEWMDY